MQGTSVTDMKKRLWPYSNVAALATIPAIWIFFALLFSATRSYASWPDEQSRNIVMLVAMATSLTPLALVLLDFISTRGAVLDIKGVKIDFSRVDLSRAEVRREAFGLPANIGISGPIVSDTSPMNIIGTLEEATKNEIVVIDLKNGDAWWVTRLLALSAGAVRANSPTVFVFIGKRANLDHQFLGLGKPNDILFAILNSKKEYRDKYQKSLRIARQVVLYGTNELLPQAPAPFSLHQDVQRYTDSYQFTEMGEAVQEQVLMDQLALKPDSLEKPPDRLTLGRLDDLFGHCLSRDEIDLNSPRQHQIAKVLNTQAMYLAMVRDRKYESIIRREDGEQLILRELFLQSQREDE